MILSRSDALFLSKILFHYEKITYYDKEDKQVPQDILGLSSRLEEFLTGEVLSPDLEKSNDSDLEDEDEDEDESSSTLSVPLPPTPTSSLSAEKLHCLDAVESTSGTFEFEENGEGTVDVLNNMNPLLLEASLVKRTGKVIEVWSEENGTYFSHEFTKLPKTWKSLLKDGITFDITE